MELLRTAAVLVLAITGLAQTACSCSGCKALTKDEMAMLRSHSEACLAESRADPKLVGDLFRGELTDEPALRRHVHCILLKCKAMSKDGKLHKLAKMAGAKAAEACALPAGDTPEEIAWNFFKCAVEKKSGPFDSAAEGAAAKGADAAKNQHGEKSVKFDQDRASMRPAEWLSRVNRSTGVVYGC